MKKTLALILALVMVFSLVACGNKAPAEPVTDDKGVVAGSNKSASGETDKDVYIDMWGVYADDNYRAEYLMKLGEEFAKKYEEETGISVQIEYYCQDDYGGCATKLAAGVSGGALPVLCQISSQQCPVFAPLCDDVRNYMDKATVDNYLDGLLVGCVDKDGKVFAVPGGRSFACMVVNLDLIKQAGYTQDDLKTWDWAKFHEIMLAVSKLGDDIEGAGLWWDTDAWIYESTLYSNGGNIDNEDGTKITFADTAAGGKFLDLVADMMADGSMYSCYNEKAAKEVGDALNAMFVEGKLGCRFCSITNYGGIKKTMEEQGADKQFEIVLAHQPAGDAGFSIVTGGNNFLFLKQSTESQKKAAASYLAYMAQDQYVAEWNDLSGYMAFTESVYGSSYYAEVAKDPNQVFIGEGIQYAHGRPVTLNWAECRKYLMDGLVGWSQDPAAYKAANGGTTDAVVKGWAEHCQKILDEAKAG